jgi:hypothetical protein
MNVYAKGMNVEGMRKAMRVPRTIHAKQMDERFAVMRNGTMIGGELGDYLICDQYGYYDVVQCTIFETLYQFVE